MIILEAAACSAIELYYMNKYFYYFVYTIYINEGQVTETSLCKMQQSSISP